MCTYLNEKNHLCNHHRDYDPVVRGLKLPRGIELISEGYIEENQYREDIEVTDYICHENSSMFKKILRPNIKPGDVGYSLTVNIKREAQ